MRIVAEDKRGIPHLLVNDPGPYPKNIYNVGLFRNLKRVFFPPSDSLLAKLEQENKKK